MRRKLHPDTKYTSDAPRVEDVPDGTTTTDEGQEDGLEADAQLLLDHLAEDEEEFT